MTIQSDAILFNSFDSVSYISTMETLLAAKLNNERYKAHEKGATDGYVFFTSAIMLWDGSYINVQHPTFFYGGGPVYGMPIFAVKTGDNYVIRLGKLGDREIFLFWFICPY